MHAIILGNNTEGNKSEKNGEHANRASNDASEIKRRIRIESVSMAKRKIRKATTECGESVCGAAL